MYENSKNVKPFMENGFYNLLTLKFVKKMPLEFHNDYVVDDVEEILKLLNIQPSIYNI